MTAAPPADEEIIASLRLLHERFLVAASSEPLVTVDSFLHYDEPDAGVTALLRRDPVIGGYLALDQPMLNVAGGGTGYDLRGAIAAFLRRVQGGERVIEGEAQRLLRALRLTDGVVPVRVRTVLLGFASRSPSLCRSVNCSRPLGAIWRSQMHQRQSRQRAFSKPSSTRQPL
jgi:hypothetical protein